MEESSSTDSNKEEVPHETDLFQSVLNERENDLQEEPSENIIEEKEQKSDFSNLKS